MTTPQDCRRVAITVRGVPKSQGSKRPVPVKRKDGSKAWRVVDPAESEEGIRAWRADVKDAAERVIAATPGWVPLSGPLAAVIVFTRRKPGGLPKRRRIGSLLLDAVHRPFQRPDLSKLLRSTEDALTAAGVWADDAQVVRYTLEKCYPGDNSHALPVPGAVIRVWQLPDVRLPGPAGDAAHSIADGGNVVGTVRAPGGGPACPHGHENWRRDCQVCSGAAARRGADDGADDLALF